MIWCRMYYLNPSSSNFTSGYQHQGGDVQIAPGATASTTAAAISTASPSKKAGGGAGVQLQKQTVDENTSLKNKILDLENQLSQQAATIWQMKTSAAR